MNSYFCIKVTVGLDFILNPADDWDWLITPFHFQLIIIILNWFMTINSLKNLNSISQNQNSPHLSPFDFLIPFQSSSFYHISQSSILHSSISQSLSLSHSHLLLKASNNTRTIVTQIKPLLNLLKYLPFFLFHLTSWPPLRFQVLLRFNPSPSLITSYNLLLKPVELHLPSPVISNLMASILPHAKALQSEDAVGLVVWLMEGVQW